MAVSVRVRFEIFKRDQFTCLYCGLSSPQAVLEVDHIVPVCEGGSDDRLNLVTSCWACNRGKGGVPLNEVLAAEDSHERSIVLLERERQLREYNAVLEIVNERIERDTDMLVEYWHERTGREIYGRELTGLTNVLERFPAQTVKRAMMVAANAGKSGSLAYVNACLKNWSKDSAEAAVG